jgi:hypothetical protein
VLTYAAVGSIPEAILAGLPATGDAVFAFDRLIDPAPCADQPDTSAGP